MPLGRAPDGMSGVAAGAVQGLGGCATEGAPTLVGNGKAGARRIGLGGAARTVHAEADERALHAARNACAALRVRLHARVQRATRVGAVGAAEAPPRGAHQSVKLIIEATITGGEVRRALASGGWRSSTPRSLRPDDTSASGTCETRAQRNSQTMKWESRAPFETLPAGGSSKQNQTAAVFAADPVEHSV